MLPNVIVIGAQKCGTSALHYYLGLHPEVTMSRPKELNFFIAERNWPRGRDWYERHFQGDARVAGESSANYTADPFFPGVPERMHSLVPHAKLVYLVRDPIERIVAQYVHNYAARRKREASRGWLASTDLAATVFEPGSTYIPRSSYFTQVSRFLEHYDRQSLLVLEQGDLRDDRQGTLRTVFHFLGIDERFDDPKSSRTRHETGSKRRKTRAAALGERLPGPLWSRLEKRVTLSTAVARPAVPEELRRRLEAALGEDIDRFREFTGRDFADWSV